MCTLRLSPIVLTFGIVMLNNFVNETCNHAERHNSQTDHRRSHDVVMTSLSDVSCSILDALYVLEMSVHVGRALQWKWPSLVSAHITHTHTRARARAFHVKIVVFGRSLHDDASSAILVM